MLQRFIHAAAACRLLFLFGLSRLMLCENVTHESFIWYYLLHYTSINLFLNI